MSGSAIPFGVAGGRSTWTSASSVGLSLSGYMLLEDAATMRTRAALCPPLTYTGTYRDHYDSFVTVDSCTG